MRRELIEKDYNIQSGIIKSPGKFEGEPIFAPHFYEGLVSGFAEELDNGKFVIEIDEEDRLLFPEIEETTEFIAMEEDNQGFFYLYEWTREDYEREYASPMVDDDHELLIEEGDITTEDHRKFFQDGKLVLTVAEDAVMWDELDKYCAKDKFWPNIWFVSDHGNAHLLSKGMLCICGDFEINHIDGVGPCEKCGKCQRLERSTFDDVDK